MSIDAAGAALAVSPGAEPLTTRAEALEAAQGLEAYFIRRVLGEVKSLGGAMGSGVAGSTFRDMLVESLADEVAASGQLGMAETVASQMFPHTAPSEGAFADPTEFSLEREQAMAELVELARPVPKETPTISRDSSVGPKGSPIEAESIP